MCFHLGCHTPGFIAVGLGGTFEDGPHAKVLRVPSVILVDLVKVEVCRRKGSEGEERKGCNERLHDVEAGIKMNLEDWVF